ncbi:3-phosphoglycerate dehydrogenase [Siculibacillus lacustris]|uniref:3-phosphoglycerate dehydrogenase n=1 Tax=Siculibacillus lacustris TaxID=1549641 RepID=A0A4Q9VXZ2_9HYPH|nr:2-hydroxyacid dehydrogenase [Siculibacillus lacustris]TBW40052.1 3-phosphoglycerate dehydrogenase [Siculibacillus lacustris]
MPRKFKALAIGDAMIQGDAFEASLKARLGPYVDDLRVGDWETDWDRLQTRRLVVEKQGPEVEIVEPLILEQGGDAELLSGLFLAISSKVMDAMPKLRIAGVARAGVENVNVKEATARGILVFNVMGRNAEAVSDFAVGLILAESRNIARAHMAIKNGVWRKKFSNSACVPELKGKTVGLFGFGFIGRRVARKLSGFDVNLLVHDTYVDPAEIEAIGGKAVDKETLLREADFISLHARLLPGGVPLIGASDFALMKPTAYIVNTARAGLVDQKALVEALKSGRIAGAGLDVHPTEPIDPASEILELDNVTLTTHIAGTTREALTRSPDLLFDDIAKLFAGDRPVGIANPEVLQDAGFEAWLKGVRQ